MSLRNHICVIQFGAMAALEREFPARDFGTVGISLDGVDP